MPETQDSPRPACRRRWRFLGRGLVVAAVAAALAWLVWNGWETHQLNLRLAALRAAGYPTTLADLAPAPVPADQNAGLLYGPLFSGPEFQRAMDEYDKLDHIDHPNGVSTAGPMHVETPEGEQARREFLVRPEIRYVLDTLRYASQLPYCIFSGLPRTIEEEASDATPPPSLQYPAGLRNAQELIGAQIQSPAESGQLPQALAWVDVARRMADQCATIPDETFLLTSRALELWGPRFLWRGARNLDVPGPATASLRDRLMAEDGREQWRHLVLTFTAGQLDKWRIARSRDWSPAWNVYRFVPPDPDAPKPGVLEGTWDGLHDWLYWSPLGRPFRAEDETFGLDQAFAQLQLGDRPYFQATASLEALDARSKPRFRRNNMYFVSAAGLVRLRDRTAAEIQSLGVALAAKAYKHDLGAYPDNLDQLAAYLHRSLPLNPQTGKAYDYKRQGAGFVVSSAPDPRVRNEPNADFWQCDK